MQVTYAKSALDRFIKLADAVEDAYPSVACEGDEGEGGDDAIVVQAPDGDVVYAVGVDAYEPADEAERVVAALQAKLSE